MAPAVARRPEVASREKTRPPPYQEVLLLEQKVSPLGVFPK